MEKIIENIIDKVSFKFPYSIKDYSENLYIENYHSHTSFSNPLIADSAVSPEDYAKRITELGTKCIYSGEHGNQGNQFEVYTVAEKYNLKYVHSCEAYWVKDRLKIEVEEYEDKKGIKKTREKKDNTNCHMVLVALNEEGREDINYILSIANEDGYYYRPRIDLGLLLSIKKENIIVTSACIAGWLYEDAETIWLKIANHFQENFFVELQPHNTDKQKKLNKRILKFANENSLQIICGLDSHSINENDSLKRDQILKYKKVFYPDEDGWYLDYPDGKTVYKRFIKQGILTEEEILISMMNTNVFSVKCQEIIFNRHFKIPNIHKDKTYEERVEILKNILREAYKKEKLKSKEKANGIKWETNEIVESNVIDYFLLNHMGLKKSIEEEGGILTTTSRGSMASFIINKLLGFTTIDRFNSEIPIYPERFLTKERVLSGQMVDCDFNVSDQEPFVRGYRNLLGYHSVYPLMAIEKLKEKAAWQLYAGANDVTPEIANEISKYIEKYNDALKYADEEDYEFIHIEDYIPEEYLELFKQSREYQGITINLKVHACGHLMLEGDIRRKIGLITAISETTGNRTLCACVEGNYLDAFGMVKNDFLIVDCVGLIKECFESIGREVPSFDELREMIDNDKKTWEIYEKGITMCVNQVEKSSTSKKAQKYKMKNLAESSAFIAAIRPGFKSLLNDFLERKPYSTGEEQIDDLLKDSSNRMIFQESIMRILQFLGLSMGETYNIIKSISKKKLKGEKLKELYRQLEDGWMGKIGNTKNFSKVWQVINDASRYSFNAPHSLSMGGDSAYLAWFKAHHTAKFYEVAIEHYQKKDKKDKIDSLVKEIIEFYNYKLGEYKFGNDNRKVNIDEKNKIIYPNLSSIKDMPKIVPEILYENRNNKFNDKYSLYNFLINESGINKTGLEILIGLDYFSKFVDINQMYSDIEIFKKYNSSKTLSKEKLNDLELKCIQSIPNKETTKQYKDFDSLEFIKQIIQSTRIPKTTILDKIKYQIKYLGYTNLTDSTISNDICAVLDTEQNNWGSNFITLYRIYDGFSKQFRANKKNYGTKCPQLEKGDIIRCSFESKQKQKMIGQDENGKNQYQKLNEWFMELKVWCKV